MFIHKPWMPFLNLGIVEPSNPFKGCKVWNNHVMITAGQEEKKGEKQDYARTLENSIAKGTRAHTHLHTKI